MPECQAYYMLEYMQDIGLSIGENALTHGEIESWQRNIGVRLNPWECRTIKRLSSAYLSEFHKASDPKAETVWEDAPYYMSAKYRNAMRAKNAIRKIAEDK